jgi:hypothetical protein
VRGAADSFATAGWDAANKIPAPSNNWHQIFFGNDLPLLGASDILLLYISSSLIEPGRPFIYAAQALIV